MFYPACQLVFGNQIALAPVVASYLCAELQTTSFTERTSRVDSKTYSEHIVYALFTFHCNGLHYLRSGQDDLPFCAALASGKAISMSLVRAREHLRDLCNFVLRRIPVANPLIQTPKQTVISGQRLVDSTTPGAGRYFPIVKREYEWVLYILVGTLVHRRNSVVDIQPYVPSRFGQQLGYCQGVVRSPSIMALRFGTLQDG